MKELPKWIELDAIKYAGSLYPSRGLDDWTNHEKQDAAVNQFLAGARAVLERVEGTKDDDFNSSLKHFEILYHCQQSFQEGRESVRAELLGGEKG